MKILIVSPHPDDLEIWMGATAAKLVQAGNKVRSIIITDGHRSPRSFECSDEEMVEIRLKEGSNAHRILGIKDFEYFGLPNAEDTEAVTKILEKELSNNYDLVYSPDCEDMHPTHSAIAKKIVDIIKESNLSTEVWAYDGWNFLHNPTKFEDIEKYLDLKIKAIRAHKSQITDKPYDEAMEKFARVRAILMDSHKLTDIKYAEVFKKLN